jgi:hypothetical protein
MYIAGIIYAYIAINNVATIVINNFIKRIET